ncbi:Vps15 protein kinase, partial [Globisporangium splendens]
MGNAAPRAQPQSQLDSASQYRTYLMDYSPRSMNIVFGSLIGDGKFLKTIYCKCDEGHLVVKIYRKFDPNEDLRGAHNSLKRISLAFTIDQQPNLIPYADYKLSLKYNVAFMVRQYFGSNLYDRICSRPFLTQIEKKWIAFQILRALEQSHSKGICHGDIKQENIMVTSWNWVFLTDFAPFKPTYIPEDDPADYNYYFCAIDATRRACSVAPERFYGASSATPAGSSSSTSTKGADAMMLSRMADSEVSVEEVEKQFLSMGIPTPSHAQTPTSANGSFPGSMPSFMRNANKREGHLQESMDIFSAGCVIAEIFLGGKPLFELPTLLRYRTGDTEHLRNTLKKVGDPRLEEMLLHMLQLDPNARSSAADYLAKYTSSHGLFPTYFESFLFRFLVLVLSRGGKVPDARIRLVCKYYGRLVREVTGVEDPEGEEFFKLRLREGYGSDRQLVMDLVAADGQTHVAQRVIEELDRKNSFKGENRRNEKDNGTMAKLEHMKSEEVDMTNLSGTFQKKKINKLHDQYNALTQKKKQSLLLDYTAETQNEKADGEDSAEQKEQDEYGDYAKRSNKSNFSGKSRKDRPKSSSTRKASGEPWSTDRNGIVIILSLVCSSIRHCEIPESKITAVYLIKSLGQYASDEVRLQRLIPFLMELFEDPSASVRALALRTLTLLLSLIETFPLSDASIFPQYILPALNSFPSDPDEMVRIAFAECLPQLAATSRRFLEIAHAMKQKSLATSTASQTSVTSMSSRGGNDISSGVSPVYLASNSFDKELNVLHKMISRYVIQLAAPDQKASSSLVKRALLVDITRLCVFFGRERTLDVVLPQLITFLNDRDWELRGAFFDYIVGLCSFVGRVTVGLYILPCIEQALFDVQEIVITKAVECLGGLCQLGLFQKNTSALVEKAKMTSALLLHPSWWIRDAVLKLMTYIAIQMGSVNANVFLSPLLRPFMKKSMVFLLDEHEQDMLIRLRDCCRPHLSRETFDAALIASSAGSNEIIAEMENYLNSMANDADTADARGGGKKNRDVLSSVDSLDSYNLNRVPSGSPRTPPPAESSSSYEHKKNEIQALKLMQQYVAIASMHMRSKMELAHSEQAARMQGHAKAERGVSSSVLAAPGGNGNPFARKISRSHLRVLSIPDMRYALSVAQPIKTSNLIGVPIPSGVPPTPSVSITSGNSTALVTKQQAAANSRSGTDTSIVPANGHMVSNGGSSSGQVHLLDNLPLHLILKMYGLEAPSLPLNSVGSSGASTMPLSGAGSYDDSSLPSVGMHALQAHNESNHFASTGGGVMVSMLNMNMRDMYGGDGVGGLLDPHQSPVSPSRQRMMKRTHSTYHHYFAFKESAMDPALRNPRKLLARLTALGVPPLPPDLGSLRQPDGSYYSIYNHPLSPYTSLQSSSSGVGASVVATPGSDRGVGISVDSGSAASSPVNTIYNTAAFGISTGSGNGGVPTANGNGAGIYASYSHRSWRPRKNVLVAELAEHTGAVNRIGAAQDFSFLASSSNDGTVKLWSIRSMQHSINQGSRCTYDGQGGVLTDMVVLENSHSVASASSNGSVHVFRVDKVNAVGGNFHAMGLKDIRTENSAVMVLDYFNNVSESLLIYATRNGEIHAWDLRMRREAWKLEVSPELGYITCMTHSLDVSWFAVGTSRGFICLWDLRFLVLIRIWRHSSHRSIHRLKSCLGLPNTLPLDETSVPLVFVAAGDGEVSVFDLSIGACRAVFRTLHVQASEAEAGRCPTLLHIPIPHRSRSVLGSLLGIYGIATAFDDIATTLHSEEPSVRAILCPSLHFRGMADALITGGEDKQIRYWDIRNGKSSYTVCGSDEAKSFYDNQVAPNDWWRMSSSHQQQMNGGGAIVATPSSAQSPAPITKPELAWKKLSPPGITICQDSSYYSSQGSVSSVAATGGGVESAVTMERRGLIPPSPAHTDCILDLTLVDLNGPMLVSSSRDGNIKISQLKLKLTSADSFGRAYRAKWTEKQPQQVPQHASEKESMADEISDLRKYIGKLGVWVQVDAGSPNTDED